MTTRRKASEIEDRLNSMTVPQLRTLARQSGLSSVTKLTKKDHLVAALAKVAQRTVPAEPVKKTTTAKVAKATDKASERSRIDHSSCDHPRTPAGRAACRAARKADSK